MSMLVKTILLQGGYYPDRFADEGRAPDVFFISEDIPLQMLQEMSEDDRLTFQLERLEEMVEAVVQAVREKYHRKRDDFLVDIFWSCDTKVTKVE